MTKRKSTKPTTKSQQPPKALGTKSPQPPPPPCDHLIPLSPTMRDRLKGFDKDLSELQRQAQSINAAKSSFIEGILVAKEIENAEKVTLTQDGTALMVHEKPTPPKN